LNYYPFGGNAITNNIILTVGLCVRNAEITISEAVNSILNQDFPHELMEIIIVDGSSKDKTLQIIENILKKSDIQKRIFTENIGLGMARQIVVEKAIGKYILWVDGDIVLPKDYARKQVEFMEKNPNVGIAEGKFGLYNKEVIVSFLENIVAILHSENEKKVPKHHASTEAAIWRTEAIREAGGFDISIKGAAEDIEAAFRVRLIGWSLTTTEEVFQEICRLTWKSFWDQYFWYGYGAHYISHKDSAIIKPYELLPPAGFIIGIFYSFIAYKYFHRKIVFLLPFHYFFKRVATSAGFFSAHIHGYGH
jgi:glycosyltransferase involved in cell wall biosynthesis